jgi:hypothetical protein
MQTTAKPAAQSPEIDLSLIFLTYHPFLADKETREEVAKIGIKIDYEKIERGDIFIGKNHVSPIGTNQTLCGIVTIPSTLKAFACLYWSPRHIGDDADSYKFAQSIGCQKCKEVYEEWRARRETSKLFGPLIVFWKKALIYIAILLIAALYAQYIDVLLPDHLMTHILGALILVSLLLSALFKHKSASALAVAAFLFNLPFLAIYDGAITWYGMATILCLILFVGHSAIGYLREARKEKNENPADIVSLNLKGADQDANADDAGNAGASIHEQARDRFVEVGALLKAGKREEAKQFLLAQKKIERPKIED